MVELATIVREAGPAYRRRFGPRMLPSHKRALDDIAACRTADMGGHVERCHSCGKDVYTYHSCRNRHCPKCCGRQSQRWEHKQVARLPACSYYLVTFTLPAELRPIARTHQRLVYSILMRAAAQTLLKLTADPRYLGATPGILGVLHTWTRSMLYHPHVHFLVTAGGLTDDGQRWREPRNPRFLVPGRVLSTIFRAKMRDALIAHRLAAGVAPSVWRHDNKWVVHAKRAGKGKQVLAYLARYIHRVALSNDNIERFENGQVTFRYRDSKTKLTRRCTLTSDEFIARFLQHVLPRGFTKVRHYGLLSSASSRKLARVHTILAAASGVVDSRQAATEPPAASGQAATDSSRSQDDPKLCPSCGVGRLCIVAKLPRRRGPP